MVKFYSYIDDHEKLKFAVICAKTEGKFVLCKHKMRDTLEFPGGHREAEEFIVDTAERELKEETGAKDFTLEPVCIVCNKDNHLLCRWKRKSFSEERSDKIKTP